MLSVKEKYHKNPQFIKQHMFCLITCTVWMQLYGVNLKELVMDYSWLVSRPLSCICLEGIRKTAKDLSIVDAQPTYILNSSLGKSCCTFVGLDEPSFPWKETTPWMHWSSVTWGKTIYATSMKIWIFPYKCTVLPLLYHVCMLWLKLLCVIFLISLSFICCSKSSELLRWKSFAFTS